MDWGEGPQDLVARWLESQGAFWSSAAAKPAFEDADAFAQPDWQAFDALIGQLFSALPDDQSARWHRAHAAIAAYRDVIQGAWVRIRTAFEAHRRAIYDPSGPPQDWRILRDRWFDIAEAEFIRTQRSKDFLDAQRDLIRVAAESWAEIPEAMREAARQQRELRRTAYQTLDRLGLDGVPIAQTPKDEVWQDGKVTLSRYQPLGAERILGPVLICHGLIGRQTMTDLRPERSMVRNLLTQGVDVFVLDWGNAGPEDADKGMDHYAGEVIPQAIQAALAASAKDRLTLFGICQGGTMAACHAARQMGDLAGLILAVAPIDFHADIHDADPAHGLLNLWVRSLEDRDHEALIAMDGNLSGELLGQVFNQLNPVRTLAKYAIEMLDCARDPSDLAVFLAMEKWLADRPDLPGALARTWLTEFYGKNTLIEGKFQMQGNPVDLARIDVPVLNIFATGDHIVPPPCSRALGRLLEGRDYQELALPTGHIGAFVSARSQALLAPSITAWLQRHE